MPKFKTLQAIVLVALLVAACGENPAINRAKRNASIGRVAGRNGFASWRNGSAEEKPGELAHAVHRELDPAGRCAIGRDTLRRPGRVCQRHDAILPVTDMSTGRPGSSNQWP